jgi:hypothetical protein
MFLIASYFSLIGTALLYYGFILEAIASFIFMLVTVSIVVGLMGEER